MLTSILYIYNDMYIYIYIYMYMYVYTYNIIPNTGIKFCKLEILECKVVY